MSEINRRSFFKLAGAAGAVAATGAAGAAAACSVPSRVPDGELPAATLAALADAVLPGELGAAGRARAVNEFQRWLAAYRPAAERTHGYGTGELSYTPPHPGPGWAAQLEALDLEAQQRFAKPFTALSEAERRDMVARQLARERDDRLTDPAEARYVAVGLIAWWVQTPEATNLCYQAAIDPNTCRPLADQANQPVRLVARER